MIYNIVISSLISSATNNQVSDSYRSHLALRKIQLKFFPLFYFRYGKRCGRIGVLKAKREKSARDFQNPKEFYLIMFTLAKYPASYFRGLKKSEVNSVTVSLIFIFIFYFIFSSFSKVKMTREDGCDVSLIQKSQPELLFAYPDAFRISFLNR